MCKKLIYFVSFILVLSLVGNVQAAWTDAGPDQLWSTTANWSGDTVPTSGTTAEIRILPGPIIKNEGAVAKEVRVGVDMDEVGALTVDGGTLMEVRWFNLGHRDGATGTLNMNSGSITVSDNIIIGRGGTGTVNMNGGTITATGDFTIGRGAATTGHVNLDGGIITAGNFVMRVSYTAVGTMDVAGGTLIIDGDKLTTIQEYIDNGWITAYDGLGTLDLDYGVTNEGKTTLKASALLLNPRPAMGSSVPVSFNQLQWTLPGPQLPGGVVTCDVYFGTDGAVENNPKVVIRQAVESASVTLAPDTTYYWAIDIYDSSISTTEPSYLSFMYTFDTMNQPPIVNAGENVATWLDNGLKVVQLEGVVSDESGGPGPATLLWTVIAQPNELNPAQISNPLAPNPTVTVIEPGSYTLQLEAGDGKFTVTDTMQIVLYADACEHAKNQEGFELIPGDVNEDCIVNELDLVILVEHWLQENYSTE